MTSRFGMLELPPAEMGKTGEGRPERMPAQWDLSLELRGEAGAGGVSVGGPGLLVVLEAGRRDGITRGGGAQYFPP